jgi:predicted DNA-binding transcriptional regulator AlpA
MARVLPITPASVPTLDELAAEPARASTLPPAVLQALLCRSATVQTILLGALMTASARTADSVSDPPEDTLLDVTEAAKRLATSPDWLYRHANRLPFTVRNGRQLRFSSEGIARYIREHTGD